MYHIQKPLNTRHFIESISYSTHHIITCRPINAGETEQNVRKNITFQNKINKFFRFFSCRHTIQSKQNYFLFFHFFRFNMKLYILDALTFRVQILYCTLDGVAEKDDNNNKKEITHERNQKRMRITGFRWPTRSRLRTKH